MPRSSARKVVGIVLTAAVALLLITPQATTHASDQTVISGDNYPKLPLSAYQFPVSRFGPGRPSFVKGLKIVSADPIRKTVTLSWKSNPANEHVDSYALYYQSMLAPSLDGGYEGVLAAVTKSANITTQIDVVKPSDSGYYPYGVNESPFTLGTDNEGELISVWVIAHNSRGWGDNEYHSPNPDENPRNFTAVMQDSSTKPFAPTILTIDPLKIDPKFASGTWPAFQRNSDINSLNNVEPRNSKWTVPWLPETDLPLTRYQSGRPTDVIGLSATHIDLKSGTLSLEWKAGPRSQKVDSYYVYADGMSECHLDWCWSALLQKTKATTFTMKLNFTSTPSGDRPNYYNGVLTAVHGDELHFWVIAHNPKGWGNNSYFSFNPDQTGDKLPTKNEVAKYPEPTKVTVQIP